MKFYQYVVAVLIALPVSTVYAQLPQSHLIVVEDKGGVSAMPYFEELGLLPEPATQVTMPSLPSKPVADTEMLPVRSELLTSGRLSPRVIQAPGLMPFFLVGDDDLSKSWLLQRQDALLQINAVGLVVNIETAESLQQLRALVPGLTLVPVSGDDIAQRLNLQHYPVLITATQIEQ